MKCWLYLSRRRRDQLFAQEVPAFSGKIRHTEIGAHTHTHTHIRMHARSHTHTHTCMHTRTHTSHLHSSLPRFHHLAGNIRHIKWDTPTLLAKYSNPPQHSLPKVLHPCIRHPFHLLQSLHWRWPVKENKSHKKNKNTSKVGSQLAEWNLARC